MRPIRLLSAAVAPLAALWLAACGDSEATKAIPDAAPRPIAVATATVEERAVPATLEVTGTLTADARTDVAAESDGRIVQVAIERGMVVAAGSVVARLDEQDAANQLREAEATEAQTRARLGLGETGSFDPSQTAGGPAQPGVHGARRGRVPALRAARRRRAPSRARSTTASAPTPSPSASSTRRS